MTSTPAPLDLDVLQAEAEFAPFPYWLDGAEHTFPHVQMLSTEQALRIETGDARTVIREIAGDDIADRLMRLPAHAMNSLLTAWMKHGGTEPGESSASTDS